MAWKLPLRKQFIKWNFRVSSQDLGYKIPTEQKGRDTDSIDILSLPGQCHLNCDHLVQLFSLKYTYFLQSSQSNTILEQGSNITSLVVNNDNLIWVINSSSQMYLSPEVILPGSKKVLSLWFPVFSAGFFFFFLRFYLFIYKERGRGEEKNWCVRDTSIGCLSHTPNWGPCLQPRHVTWLGIKPATFRFIGCHSIHWATSAQPGFQQSS